MFVSDRNPRTLGSGSGAPPTPSGFQSHVSRCTPFCHAHRSWPRMGQVKQTLVSFMGSRKSDSEIPQTFLPWQYFPYSTCGIWGGRNRLVTCLVRFIRISCSRAHKLVPTPDTLSGRTLSYASEGGSQLCVQSRSALVGDRTIFQSGPLLSQS